MSILIKYAGAYLENEEIKEKRDDTRTKANDAAKKKADVCAHATKMEKDIAKAATDLDALAAKGRFVKESIKRERDGLVALKQSTQVAREAVEWMRAMSENTYTPTVGNLPETIAKFKQSKMGSSENLRRSGLDCVASMNLLRNKSTAHELLQCGYAVSDLRKDGVTAQKLREEGFLADILKRGGYSAKETLAGGYTCKELKDDGGWTASELKQESFTASQLLSGGYSAKEAKQGGYSAKETLAGGYTWKELKDDGGWTASELKQESFTASQLLSGGMKNEGGWTLSEFKTENFVDGELDRAGFPGYTAAERKSSGWTAAQCKNGKYSAKQCKTAKYTAKEMNDGGYTAKEMNDGGYTAKECLDGGYTSGISSFQLIRSDSTFTSDATCVRVNGGPGVFKILPEAGPTDSFSACHKNPFSIPSGFQVVSESDPDFELIRTKIIAGYGWGAYYATVLSKDDQNTFKNHYCTKNTSPPGKKHSGTHCKKLSDGRFQSTDTSVRLLIRSSSPPQFL
eukprot:g5072.t1